MIGANGAGKTTLFNVVTGDFPATQGRVLFFGEDVTALPPHERIRMGLRRTYQSSLLFRDLTVRDNLFLAVRGVSRNRFSFLRASRQRPGRASSSSGCGSPTSPTSPVSALSHGQQRQLEIGMALAGAPRLILFDEPAAGLSPGERAELVALLRGLPAHIGFVLIEHDLDIALRVVDRVTVMHNARVLKHGSPAEIENDAEVQAIYMGERRALILEIQNLDVHYGRAHALQGVSLALDRGVLAVVGRNGMGKTTLCNAVTGLVRAVGEREARRRGDPRAGAERDHRQGRRLRAAGPAGVALAVGRRASPAGPAPGPVDGRAHLPDVPAARRAQGQRRRRALGRRAADARDLARAALQPEAAGHGRAHRGPGADHRAAGRGDAEGARRRGRDLGAADRAEPRRGHRRRRHRRRDGERPHRALDARRRAGRRPRAAAAPARREDGRRRSRRTPAVEDDAARTGPGAHGQARQRRGGGRAAGAPRRAHDPRLHAVGLHRPRPRGGGRTSRRWRRRRSRASWSSRWRRPSDARPTSPAPSTPRGASSSTCAAASRSWGCAR